MTGTQTAIFGMTGVKDYLSLCEDAVTALEAEPADVLRAFSAILALNHLPDWLHNMLDTEQRQALGLDKAAALPEIRRHFEATEVRIRLLRNLANGFKHLRLGQPTSRVSGHGRGPCGVGPYGSSYLLVDLRNEDDFAADWVTASNLCRNVHLAWRDLLRPIHPEGAARSWSSC